MPKPMPKNQEYAALSDDFLEAVIKELDITYTSPEYSKRIQNERKRIVRQAVCSRWSEAIAAACKEKKMLPQELRREIEKDIDQEIWQMYWRIEAKERNTIVQAAGQKREHELQALARGNKKQFYAQKMLENIGQDGEEEKAPMLSAPVEKMPMLPGYVKVIDVLFETVPQACTGARRYMTELEHALEQQEAFRSNIAGRGFDLQVKRDSRVQLEAYLRERYAAVEEEQSTVLLNDNELENYRKVRFIITGLGAKTCGERNRLYDAIRKSAFQQEVKLRYEASGREEYFPREKEGELVRYLKSISTQNDAKRKKNEKMRKENK